jgi:hypothetical protein
MAGIWLFLRAVRCKFFVVPLGLFADADNLFENSIECDKYAYDGQQFDIV